ncbi:MAG: hypothetical protein M9885_14130 [Burkholderiaceae bacterium]|nr:hypothetical protein [Burkholderiaceae bacterium]
MDPCSHGARTTSSAPRHDLYAVVHKALRLCMADSLVRFGRMDPQDPAQCADAIECVRSMLDLAAVHIEDENRFVHPALAARCDGAADRSAREHDEHEREIRSLRDALGAFERAAPATRGVQSRHLYQQLALYVGENLVHMHHEETHNMPALWAQYDDGELLAIEQAIVSSIEPQTMARFLRWMLPAVSHPERVALLPADAPDALVDLALDIVGEYVGPAERDRVAAARDPGSVLARAA